MIIITANIVIEDNTVDDMKVSSENKKLYLLEDSELYHKHLKSNTFSISDVRNILLFKAKKCF